MYTPRRPWYQLRSKYVSENLGGEWDSSLVQLEEVSKTGSSRCESVASCSVHSPFKSVDPALSSRMDTPDTLIRGSSAGAPSPASSVFGKPPSFRKTPDLHWAVSLTPEDGSALDQMDDLGKKLVMTRKEVVALRKANASLQAALETLRADKAHMLRQMKEARAAPNHDELVQELQEQLASERSRAKTQATKAHHEFAAVREQLALMHLAVARLVKKKVLSEEQFEKARKQADRKEGKQFDLNECRQIQPLPKIDEPSDSSRNQSVLQSRCSARGIIADDSVTAFEAAAAVHTGRAVRVPAAVGHSLKEMLHLREDAGDPVQACLSSIHRAVTHTSPKPKDPVILFLGIDVDELPVIGSIPESPQAEEVESLRTYARLVARNRAGTMADASGHPVLAAAFGKTATVALAPVLYSGTLHGILVVLGERHSLEHDHQLPAIDVGNGERVPGILLFASLALGAAASAAAHARTLLGAVNILHGAAASAFNPDALPNVMEQLTGAVVPCDRGILWIVDRNDDLAAGQSQPRLISLSGVTVADAGLALAALHAKEPLLVEDVMLDPRYNADVDGSDVESCLCVPVMADGVCVAVAQLVNRRSGVHRGLPFLPGDARVVEATLQPLGGLKTKLEAQQAQEALGLVGGVAREVVKAVGPEELCRAVARAVADCVTCEESRLWFVDTGRGHVWTPRISEEIPAVRLLSTEDAPVCEAFRTQDIARGGGRVCIPVVRDRFVSCILELDHSDETAAEAEMAEKGVLLASPIISQAVSKFSPEIRMLKLDLDHSLDNLAFGETVSSSRSAWLELSDEALHWRALKTCGIPSFLEPCGQLDILSGELMYSFLQTPMQLALAAETAAAYGLVGAASPLSGVVCHDLIDEIMEGHGCSSFTNFLEASTCCHVGFLAVHNAQVLDHLYLPHRAALFLSTLARNLDSPGRSNRFLCRSGSSVARLYNDVAVTQNHAAATLCGLLAKERTAWLTPLPKDVQAATRRSFIGCILATDSSRRGLLLQQAEHFSAAPPWETNEMNGLAAQRALEVLCVAADNGHPTLPLHQSVFFADLLAEEFAAEAAHDIALGLPVNPMLVGMDSPLRAARYHLSVLDGVVIPLWVSVAEAVGGLEDRVGRAAALRDHWEEALNDGEQL
mmetsp:Transcript_47721/g.126230  ORF Transcript_47721/g.126230 Transcript_47721/m.126230 type:complete len:1140 (+) Transcript_47721:73-3492(+)